MSTVGTSNFGYDDSTGIFACFFFSGNANPSSRVSKCVYLRVYVSTLLTKFVYAHGKISPRFGCDELGRGEV
jgi:hypothetical protein